MHARGVGLIHSPPPPRAEQTDTAYAAPVGPLSHMCAAVIEQQHIVHGHTPPSRYQHRTSCAATLKSPSSLSILRRSDSPSSIRPSTSSRLPPATTRVPCSICVRGARRYTPRNTFSKTRHHRHRGKEAVLEVLKLHRTVCACLGQCWLACRPRACSRAGHGQRGGEGGGGMARSLRSQYPTSK